mgnify:CR=1 FL=1
MPQSLQLCSSVLPVCLPPAQPRLRPPLPEEGMEIEKKDETEEYARYMENKLEQAISVMEGAGKVKVMITVSASKELVVEKDMPVTRSNTVENDSEGGSRNVNEYGSTEETVYSKESGYMPHPYLK